MEDVTNLWGFLLATLNGVSIKFIYFIELFLINLLIALIWVLGKLLFADIAVLLLQLNSTIKSKIKHHVSSPIKAYNSLQAKICLNLKVFYCLMASL